MRLIRITTNYGSYLRQFYASHQELKGKTYREQYQALMADCFGWADFWTHAFGKLGYEVWEPVGNAWPMQKTWAHEHDIPYEEETWLTDIVAAQVKHFRPDILFVNDYVTYSASFLQRLRHEGSIRLVMGWCGAPYRDGNVFMAYDVVLSNIPGLVRYFREAGHHSELVRHAFEPRVLEKLGSDGEPSTLFSFVGSIAKGDGFHNQREQLLRQLLERTSLQIWSEVRKPSMKEMRRLRIRQGIYDVVKMAGCVPGLERMLPRLPRVKHYYALEQRPRAKKCVDPVIAAHAQPGLFGLAMYKQLRDSKVSLNTHIDIAAPHASNMRLFEATGVGTCLLTDAQPDLNELYESDVEVVTYRNAGEAVEKVRYLLDHEEERQQIARAGQQRTLRDHTFDLRAQQLDALIRKWV